MNVVEKDTLKDEGNEILHAEEAGSRKNGTRAVIATASGKFNRLPTLAPPGRQLKLDFKRYLGERSRELQAFVAPLEDRIRGYNRYRSQKHRSSARPQAKVAELVIEVIRQLAYKETGVFNLEAPVPQLLSALFAGSVEVGIVTGLARRARKALLLRDKQEREIIAVNGAVNGANKAIAGGIASRGLAYDVARELDELVMLLKWYVRRKMSLFALEVEVGDEYSLLESGSPVLNDDRDLIYGLDVLHDHQVFGVKGCLLTCGLRLLGRDGEALWLRVSLLNDGKPVMARPDWSSWTDPGGAGFVGGEAVQVLPEIAQFCSLVPIRPNSQRLIIDQVCAFVPYAALQLSPGRSEVEVVATVIDGEGREVLSVARSENICVPQRQLSLAPVPAPHSLGMWPHDVVSGDKISELTVAAGFKVVAGWERHSISVAFDLSLFMHAGESVMLECRFVNSRGDIVELSSLGMPFVASELNVAVESLSSYRYRRVLHPRGAWALYQGLCIDIPVEFLLLNSGTHEITCELVVVSTDERVLCGDMSRVVVHVPERDSRQHALVENGAGERRVAELNQFDGRLSIAIDSLEIEPAWLYGGDECIRVQARFAPQSNRQQLADLAAGRVGELFSPYRVEISLEREDGHVLLQAYSDPLGMSFKPVTRSVCVDPYTGSADHVIVSNFRRDEVLGWSLGADGGRGSAKSRIFARITALSLSGEALVSESRELFVKPISEGDRRVVHVTEPTACIVDASAYVNVQGERLTSRVVVNMPSGDNVEGGVQVQFILCAPGGRRDVIAIKELSFQHGAVWTRQVTGLCQYAVECDFNLSEFPSVSGCSVEASLIGVNGEVLDLIQQPVKVSGVLSELDENAADFDSDLAGTEFSADVNFGSLPDSAGRATARGLWGRLFRS
jgi:hypothetical protein